MTEKPDFQAKPHTPPISEEEEIANWEELYAAFRKETPSSPAWYQIADVCIGVLLADRLQRLKMALASEEGGQ